MAAELARDHGIETRWIVTTDDVVVAARESRFRRGVAGNVSVFKIAARRATRAGAWTPARRSRARRTRTYTVGVALEPCAAADPPLQFEIGPDEIEIGMGIHGEPGVMRGALATADEIVDMILTGSSEMRGPRATRSPSWSIRSAARR